MCVESLSELQRKEVHARILQRMEDTSSDHLEEVAADLVRHASGCGMQDKSYLYRGMAARHAFSQGRFLEAREFFHPFVEKKAPDPAPVNVGDETAPIDDPKLSILEVQRLLGEIELESGGVLRSREILDQVLRQTQALGKSPSLALGSAIGRARFQGGEVVEARLDLLRASPPGFDSDPWVILARAESEILSDRYGEARRLLDSIVSVGLERAILGVRWHRARAAIEFHLGQWQSVLAHLLEARVLVLEEDLQEEMPSLLLDEARVHLARGELARSVSLLGRVNVALSVSSQPRVEVGLYGLRGEVAFLGGRWDEARSSYEIALERARNYRQALVLPFLMQGLGWIADAEGKIEEAHRWARDAWARFQTFSCSRGLADCSHLLGRLELQRGRSQEAGEHLDDALRLHAELGVEWRVPGLYLDLASLAESEKQEGRVAPYLSLARRIARRSDHRPTQALVYRILAARAASEKKTEKAEKYYQRAVAALR
jgi:tetratricopeptide (TPR) repeat protein